LRKEHYNGPRQQQRTVGIFYAKLRCLVTVL